MLGIQHGLHPVQGAGFIRHWVTRTLILRVSKPCRYPHGGVASHTHRPRPLTGGGVTALYSGPNYQFNTVSVLLFAQWSDSNIISCTLCNCTMCHTPFHFLLLCTTSHIQCIVHVLSLFVLVYLVQCVSVWAYDAPTISSLLQVTLATVCW